jgi:hypothetical protein
MNVDPPDASTEKSSPAHECHNLIVNDGTNLLHP